MLKPKKNLLIIVFITINLCVFSKDLPKIYDVSVELSQIEKKQLAKANELISEGMDIWVQVNQRFNPETVLSHQIDSIYNIEAYPLLAKAAECFLEGTTAKYELYHKNCLEFWNKHSHDYPTGVDNAKRLQKEALNYLEKSKVNRRVAENYVNQYVYAYDRFYEAISLEIIATKKEGRALQIYRDWPIHYAYEWDEDVEVNLFSPKFAVVKTEPKVIKPEVKSDIELPDSMIIFYMVQIAAHTIQITPKYLKENVYNGTMAVQELKEEGWFKYTIGHYKTFEEAEKLLNQINVAKAFVVAYKNGKRVPLKEAIEPSPQNPQKQKIK
jgi:hypothetical protein